LAEIYGRDRATGINTGNVDNDEEEVCQEDAIGVDLRLDDETVGREDEEEIDEFGDV
ncbi:hypothetical protein PanWU01x14_210110, partial [Parasponia andersonii]